jgi:hypothetical protein
MRPLAFLLLLVTLNIAAMAQSQPGAAVNAQSSESAATITVPGPVVADYGKNVGGGNSVEDKIAKEVRHELLMLPYYSLFDDLGYTVQGRTVTLTGVLTSQDAITKNDAEGAVKRIEGVESVVNNIQVLPPSPVDDGIRRRTYQKLMRTGGLYAVLLGGGPEHSHHREEPARHPGRLRDQRDGQEYGWHRSEDHFRRARRYQQLAGGEVEGGRHRKLTISSGL